MSTTGVRAHHVRIPFEAGVASFNQMLLGEEVTEESIARAIGAEGKTMV